MLFVAFDFPPMANAGIHRNLATVCSLAKAGWHPVVLTVDENQTMFPHRDLDRLAKVPPEATILRPGMIDPYDNWVHRVLMGQRSKLKRAKPADDALVPPAPPSTTKRARAWLGDFLHSLMMPDRFAGWVPYAIAAGKRAIAQHRPDVILSTSPCISGHVVASRLAKHSGLPWVLDFRDPWLRYAFAKKRPAPIAQYERRMERRYLERGDAVVVTADALREEWRATYPHLPAEKFELIYNAHNGVLPDDEPAESFDKFTLTWTGTLYPVPVHEDLLRGLLRAFEQRPDMRERFQAVFLGTHNAEFRALIHEHGLADVIELRGQRPRAECTRVLMGAHAAYYSVYHHNQVSMKLYQYMRTRIPMLAILPPGHEVHRLLRDTDTPAWLCDEGDPAAVARHLLDLFGRWERGELTRPDAQHAAEAQHAFTWEHAGRRQAELLARVVERRRSE